MIYRRRLSGGVGWREGEGAKGVRWRGEEGGHRSCGPTSMGLRPPENGVMAFGGHPDRVGFEYLVAGREVKGLGGWGRDEGEEIGGRVYAFHA